MFHENKAHSHLPFLITKIAYPQGNQNPLKIEQAIDMLKDDEISEKYELSEVKIENILKFLSEYGFIEIKDNGRKLKVGVSLQKFLEETQTMKVEA